MMNPRRLDRLMRFCVAQYAAFEPRDWVSRWRADRAGLAVAAKFLSMTSWYGYQETLEEIAGRLDPGVAAPGGFERAARAIGFEAGDFALAIRSRIHGSAGDAVPQEGATWRRHSALGAGFIGLAVISYVALRGRIDR